MSPILFSVYLDDLLKKNCRIPVLDVIGVICLLVLASALRILLNICSTFADTHGLSFNANKTQLICFHRHSFSATPADIFFRDTLLQYTDEVTHLGHILTSNLNDRSDIIRVVKDQN